MAFPNIATAQSNRQIERALHDQLVQRRERLLSALAVNETTELARLLQQVDAALDRFGAGTYGICEYCHDPIETDRLITDPLVRFCLDHLPPAEQRALEQDLETAARVQTRLLPPRNFQRDGWHVAYHYKPLRIVSGDYCDLVNGPEESLYFMVGDVSGKGVAASIVMANLNALFRTLIPFSVALSTLVERANRALCESMLPTQFASLVCGRADAKGEIEICNAGHVPPLMLHDNSMVAIGSHATPIGLFSDQQFPTEHIRLSPGDKLLLMTDGISETRNREQQEYGSERLRAVIGAHAKQSPEDALARCLEDVTRFRNGEAGFDDETLMLMFRVS